MNRVLLKTLFETFYADKNCMPSLLTNNIFLKLLWQSDWLSQSLFWLLMAMSVGCWWVFIYKLYGFAAKQAQAESTLARLQSITTLEELTRLATALKATVTGALLDAGLTAVRKTKAHQEKAGNFLMQHEQEYLALSIDEAFMAVMKHETSNMAMLKLSAETGTLLGLFGTVWGLIHAFNKISDKQIADIPTVAPGIAEALIITFTGLFVAIPALVMYHLLTHKIAELEETLRAIADRSEWIINASQATTSLPQGIRIVHETPLSQNTQ